MKRFVKAITGLVTVVMFTMSLILTTFANPAQIRWLSEPPATNTTTQSSQNINTVDPSLWTHDNDKGGIYSHPASSASNPENQGKFSDVNSAHWAHANIEKITGLRLQ